MPGAASVGETAGGEAGGRRRERRQPDLPPADRARPLEDRLPAVQQQILDYLYQCGANYWQAVPSQVIAKALNLFPSYVREQAHQLVRKGLIGVRQGRGGGYYPMAAPVGAGSGAADGGSQPSAEPAMSATELRRFMRHHVGLWRRYGVPVAFVRLHWEQWPRWVEAHGAAVARSLLVEAAHRARSALRAVDLIGQDSEDALVVVLPHTTPEAARRVVERLREHLRHPPLRLADRLQIDMDPACRIASPPQDGQDAGAILRALQGGAEPVA